MYKENLYGTMEYSPPELFCRDTKKEGEFITKATATDYQKTESFALGTVLYAIRNKENLPWMTPIVTVRDREKPNWEVEDPILQKLMLDEMQKCIEEPLNKIPKDPAARSVEQHYDFVIYNVLREDPTKRWTMDQSREYMEKYLLKK